LRSERVISYGMGIIEVQAAGGTVLVEISPAYGSESTSIGDRVAAHVDQALKRARSTVTRVAVEMAGAIQEIPESSRPESLAVEFSISFSAEGDAVIARGGAQASLRCTLTFGATDSSSIVSG